MENFEQVGKEIRSMKDKVNLIYTALVGNELSEDGGMIRRLEILENEVQVLRQFKNKFLWTMTLIASGTGVLGFVLQFLISVLLKK